MVVALSLGPVGGAPHRCGDQGPRNAVRHLARHCRVFAVVGCGDGEGMNARLG